MPTVVGNPLLTEPLFQHPFEVLAETPLPEGNSPLLILHYTELCNAKCAHCLVEAGPDRHTRGEPRAAREAIRGAAEIDGLELVVFSGGESFIYLETVLELCRFAHEQGLRTRVVSNGYWARTPERAAEMLARIANEGVDQLVISFDEFHLPFVDRRRVVNVFLGAQKAETLPYLLFSAVLRPEPGNAEIRYSDEGVPWPGALLDLLTSYGFSAEDCIPRQLARAQARLLPTEASEAFKDRILRERALIHSNRLVQGGRAGRELSAELLSEEIDRDPGGTCPFAGREITVPTSGRLFPCCSTWSNFPGHAFGSIGSSESFAAQVTSMYDDPLVSFIRRRGPGQLVQYLRKAGHELPGRYSDICHMCDGMLSALSLSELRQAAEACDAQLAWTRWLKEDPVLGEAALDQR